MIPYGAQLGRPSVCLAGTLVDAYRWVTPAIMKPRFAPHAGFDEGILMVY
jgi:hypothetical protein